MATTETWAVQIERCETCQHMQTSYGRFYGRTWTDHCRVKGCDCKAMAVPA